MSSELDTEVEEHAILDGLAADIRDQDELERDIGRQADQLLALQANERDQKRLDKSQAEKSKIVGQIRKIEARLEDPTSRGLATSTRLEADLDAFQSQLESLENDISEITTRIRERQPNLDGAVQKEIGGQGRLPNETQREFLIRTGKITPFAKIISEFPSKREDTLKDALLNAEVGQPEGKEFKIELQDEAPRSHRVLTRPGFMEATDNGATPSDEQPVHSRKRRRVNYHGDDDTSRERVHTQDDERIWQKPKEDESDSDYSRSAGLDSLGSANGSSDIHDVPSSGDDDYTDDITAVTPRQTKSQKARAKAQKDDLTGLDDGNEQVYESRLHDWATRRKLARRRCRERSGNSADVAIEIGQDEHEYCMPHPSAPETEFDDGYRMPGDIYPALFDYQKTGTQWLWELYSQQVGGIVGDEMGLGKTIQIIAFLAGLHHSKKMTKPVVIVAPATVMKQWVNEFHTWWPPFRVSILHTSGSGMVDIGRESRIEEELLSQGPRAQRKGATRSQKAAQRIVNRVVEKGHVLVTTYSGLQTYADLLVPLDWEYAVLDEGHKIRNPNAAITLYCKELRTANRIILSGTPMQNNLTELWSLFDFIFPMRLGNLVDFKNQFDIPIRIGGYVNASNLQIQTANKCAEALKDAISPYLLQRLKADVAADLPKKSERVLFCRLTRPQREAYERFLAGDDMKSILNGKRQVLYGVDILRKICNHPDLQDHKNLSVKVDYNYGSGNKSGKMVVVKELLDIWKRGGHKTLLFAQHRIMLDILERFVKTMPGINYRRMDGTTPISSRQTIVDEFNTNPEAHLFLLTTKVGGLGINLTGADRVIIFDPDWNPSTDIQARERAWRLGQKREVEIYRLMVAGTIEEKIFHRQIFKQFLTNKILRDPKQRQTFQMQDLHDLFTLGDNNDDSTETGRIFQGLEVKFDEKPNSEVAQPVANAAGIANPGQSRERTPLGDIAGIASIEPLEAEKEKEAPSEAQDTSENTADDRLMESLFARSGVQSALEHDQIINGKKAISADPKMIEREARRIAEDAAFELKRAEDIARTVPAGVPTWTGQFGTTGRPAGTGGPASSSLLTMLRSRQAEFTAGTTPHSSTPTRRAQEGGGGRQGKDFLKLIRDYIMSHGGRVYTQNLIDHFNRHCTTPQRTAEFKAMLKEIATLQKGSRGRGSWVLKDEYKGRS